MGIKFYNLSKRLKTRLRLSDAFAMGLDTIPKQQNNKIQTRTEKPYQQEKDTVTEHRSNFNVRLSEFLAELGIGGEIQIIQNFPPWE